MITDHIGPCGKENCPQECINCKERTSLRAELTNCTIECSHGTKQYEYSINNFYNK